MAVPLALAAMMAGGSAMSAYGRYTAGKQAKRAKRFEAQQMQQNAQQLRAASQREALEIDRQSRLAMSRALAVAAASGGGASDPTVLNLMGDLAQEGQYRRMVALYEGEQAAGKQEMGADISYWEGNQALKAGKLEAVGTMLEGGSSLYSKYWQTK